MKEYMIQTVKAVILADVVNGVLDERSLDYRLGVEYAYKKVLSTMGITDDAISTAFAECRRARAEAYK